jgi:FixJ family two-component response regulator
MELNPNDLETTPAERVFVVDDDDNVRKSMKWLIESANFEVRLYESADQFLDSYDQNQTGCIVLDVQMPGMDGLELQQRLLAKGYCPPIIFVTGYGDVPTVTQAMKSGAIEFVEKPVNEKILLAAIRKGLDEDTDRRRRWQDQTDFNNRVELLNEKQAAVLSLIGAGKSQNEIANEIGLNISQVCELTDQTVEKMGVQNEYQLIRLVKIHAN